MQGQTLGKQLVKLVSYNTHRRGREGRKAGQERHWISEASAEVSGGEGRSKVNQRVMVAEDFSCFQQQIPGMFYFVGITPKEQDMAKAAPNHSPRFHIDESGLLPGARSLAALAVDFLTQKP